MVNKHGDRYLKDYDLGEPLDVSDPRHPMKRTMELGPRDKLSQCFIKERAKGNTIESAFGDVVHLDIRHLSAKNIRLKLPFVRELALNYAGIDPIKEPIPVRPVVHYMMGGIHTDIDGATPLPGLFAAGECACVSINGANRLGSNSLTELLVFGRRAGHAAARFAREHEQLDTDALEKQVEDERQRILREFLTRQGGTERIATLRTELWHSMEEGAGIYRTEESLKRTDDTVETLQERYAKLQIDDRSSCYNTDLIAALELRNMLDVAEAVLHSALERRESRGSHQRTDHPDRDDDKYLKHSLAHWSETGSPRIEYQDVVITKWPPAERVYGDTTAETKT